MGCRDPAEEAGFTQDKRASAGGSGSSFASSQTRAPSCKWFLSENQTFSGWFCCRCSGACAQKVARACGIIFSRCTAALPTLQLPILGGDRGAELIFARGFTEPGLPLSKTHELSRCRFTAQSQPRRNSQGAMSVGPEGAIHQPLVNREHIIPPLHEPGDQSPPGGLCRQEPSGSHSSLTASEGSEVSLAGVN